MMTTSSGDTTEQVLQMRICAALAGSVAAMYSLGWHLEADLAEVIHILEAGPL